MLAVINVTCFLIGERHEKPWNRKRFKRRILVKITLLLERNLVVLAALNAAVL